MAAYISNLFLEPQDSRDQGLMPRYLCLQGSWPGSGESWRWEVMEEVGWK